MVSASLRPSKGAYTMPPDQLQAPPCLVVTCIPEQQFAVFEPVRKAQSQPSEARQHYAAGHEFERLPVLIRSDRLDPTGWFDTNSV